MSITPNPILTGTWETARWELYVADDVPDEGACTAAGCVAIVDLERDVVAMTRSERSQGVWETPAGHREPGETVDDTRDREAREEVGFIVSDATLFAYRRMTRIPGAILDARARHYPNTSYIPYFYATTDEPRVPVTGEEITEAADFSLPQLETMVQDNLVSPTELTIIKLGLEAARRAQAM